MKVNISPEQNWLYFDNQNVEHRKAVLRVLKMIDVQAEAILVGNRFSFFRLMFMSKDEKNFLREYGMRKKPRQTAKCECL